MKQHRRKLLRTVVFSCICALSVSCIFILVYGIPLPIRDEHKTILVTIDDVCSRNNLYVHTEMFKRWYSVYASKSYSYDFVGTLHGSSITIRTHIEITSRERASSMYTIYKSSLDMGAGFVWGITGQRVEDNMVPWALVSHWSAFKWGEESFCGTLQRNGQEIATVFCGRKGNIVYYCIMSGMSQLEPEQFNRLLSLKLSNLSSVIATTVNE